MMRQSFVPSLAKAPRGADHDIPQLAVLPLFSCQTHGICFPFLLSLLSQKEVAFAKQMTEDFPLRGKGKPSVSLRSTAPFTKGALRCAGSWRPMNGAYFVGVAARATRFLYGGAAKAPPPAYSLQIFR